jgi:hypothetical protein
MNPTQIWEEFMCSGIEAVTAPRLFLDLWLCTTNIYQAVSFFNLLFLITPLVSLNFSYRCSTLLNNINVKDSERTLFRIQPKFHKIE